MSHRSPSRNLTYRSPSRNYNRPHGHGGYHRGGYAGYGNNVLPFVLGATTGALLGSAYNDRVYVQPPYYHPYYHQPYYTPYYPY